MDEEFQGFITPEERSNLIATRKFYDKLQCLSEKWQPLEGDNNELWHYRLEETGPLALG